MSNKIPSSNNDNKNNGSVWFDVVGIGNYSDDYCINSMISTTANRIWGFWHQLIVGLDLIVMDNENGWFCKMVKNRLRW